MFKKTLVIEACKSISLDADKIREYRKDIDQLKADEMNTASIESNAEAHAKMSTGEFIDVDFQEEQKELESMNIDKETGEIFE